MARADRLLALLQALRRHRYPVTGEALAAQLSVSLRTLYRDIATLRGQGAHIEGEAGLGYVLKPGFLLPPLMFTQEEIEALVLGGRWVAQHGDAVLGAAAREAVDKIAAVLPEALRRNLDGTGLLVARPSADAPAAPDMGPIRVAMRDECKLVLDYRDAGGATSQRTVWPVAIGFFEQTRILVAWCELRQAFRHFRLDRIAALEVSAARYPRHRQALLQAWHASEGIPEQ
ncbi:YafY family protein [Herbaspirillum sp. SJZ107]|uniref:helix-turn-helix transcriptional regulator n=1 Tax=Herbaspirillum sp. SJZ107 TaxID=2572881 RepID=UPI00114EFB81|nr:YafY family protein [Herbaspirillum sp. SJZ107]TQK04978.1 putative DNA-binding transcriptional regulator YafY [Herbaspirillum sp. SJZ107]